MLRQRGSSLFLARCRGSGSLLGRSSASPLALRALSSSNSNGGEAEPGEVGKSKSWAPADTTQLHKMARQSMLHELAVKQQSTLEGVVDWFLTNMPATYFRQTSEEARLEHLLAITSMMEPNFFDSFRFQERWVDSRREITFIQPGSKRSPGSLLSLMESLPPADGTLSRVKVFVSLDGNLAINVFSYAPKSQVKEPPTDADKANLLQYAALVQAREDTGPGGATALEPSPLFEPEALESYLAWCEGEYVRRSHPRRFLTQRLLYEKVKGSEGVAVHIESYDGSEQGTLAVDEAMGQGVRPHWVTLALANVMPKIALTQVLRLFLPHELKVLRVHMDLVNDPRNGGSVTMLRALVMPPIGDVQKDGGVSSWASPDAWEPLKAALPRLKWLDETVFRLGLESEIKMGLRHAEVTNALVSMVYGILHKVNPWAFTRTHMSQWLETPRYGRHAMAIAQLFIDRFNPDAPLSNEEFTKRADSLCEKFRRDVELTELQVLLCKMVDAVRSTLRTNLYVPKRYALSMRLSPELLMTAEEQAAKEIPYGVFFVHGRRFNAFHVRFRDIARGGMRIVTPLTAEQVAFEGTRQFDEAYGLAFAQQLKNKDIPEGGSKMVVLVDTSESTKMGKHFAVRKSIKAASDSILDLLVNAKDTKPFVVDYGSGKPELLYLGPDEQVIPQDISWIVSNAARRGHPIPTVFMSSKPDAGINHKQYGVTSEGIAVFLDTALGHMGINPRDGNRFTVKLTGGPDGDVAGNMIKILHREYGENVAIVGVADGTGCAEDPDGLSLPELLRLVHEDKPIASFDTGTLGPSGVLHTCETDAGTVARNTMHNRVKSDVFVPGGGRPNTINANNWKDFISADGIPSSPLIVEGANLFISNDVRQKLYDEAGVVIVKDSSANKCGVICSSYEIATGMLLSELDFTSHKEEIVEDVLHRLRTIARMEAELLFKEQKHHPGPLPKISEKVSGAINRLTDCILAELEAADPCTYVDLLTPLVLEHLPNSVVRLASGDVSRFPPQYLRCVMASTLASSIVYREGVSFVASQPAERLGQLAIDYCKSQSDVRDLVRALESGQVTDAQRDEVVSLLSKGGVRALLGVY